MLKVYGLFLVLLLALLFVGNYGASHGYISVTVDGNQPTNIVITNQKTNAVITIKNSKGTVKKLVPSGPYEVNVTAAPKSAWQAVAVGRFLTNTNILFNRLHDESAREIVGYEPGSCMNYVADTFSSYTCNASLDTLKLQVPPSGTDPTVVSTPISNSNKTVNNIIPTAGGLVALVTSNDPDANYNEESFQVLSPALQTTNEVPVKGGIHYTELTPYKSGFLAHDRTYTHFAYFATADAAGQTVTVHPPTDTTLRPTVLSASGNDFAILYVNNSDTGKNQKSIVLINKGGKETSYTMPSHVTMAKLCGTGQLCSLEPTSTKTASDSQWMLGVYTINGSKLVKDFSVANVNTFEPVSGGVAVARTSGGILFVDTANKSGYTQLSMGDYNFCGIQSLGDSYLICATDKIASRNSALHVLPKQAVVAPIDQFALALEKNSNIKSVSVYKNNITIVPNYGELVYDMTIHSYTYDQSKVDGVNSAISQAIASLQLSANGYTVNIVGQ